MKITDEAKMELRRMLGAHDLEEGKIFRLAAPGLAG